MRGFCCVCHRPAAHRCPRCGRAYCDEDAAGGLASRPGSRRCLDCEIEYLASRPPSPWDWQIELELLAAAALAGSLLPLSFPAWPILAATVYPAARFGPGLLRDRRRRRSFLREAKPRATGCFPD